MKLRRLAPRAGRFHLRPQAGMTLIEVVVALAITSLAIAAIINGYNFCTNSAQKAEFYLAANAKAMERVEETRSAMWDTVQFPILDEVVSTNFPIKNVTLELSGSGGTIVPATVQTTISQISVNPPLKRIRVDCIWEYRGVQLITNTIETCRAPNQ